MQLKTLRKRVDGLKEKLKKAENIYQSARNQQVYHVIDEMTKEELIAIRCKIRPKYKNLFNNDGYLYSEDLRKFERLYYTIDSRIVKTLEKWR